MLNIPMVMLIVIVLITLGNLILIGFVSLLVNYTSSSSSSTFYFSLISLKIMMVYFKNGQIAIDGGRNFIFTWRQLSFPSSIFGFSFVYSRKFKPRTLINNFDFLLFPSSPFILLAYSSPLLLTRWWSNCFSPLAPKFILLTHFALIFGAQYLRCRSFYVLVSRFLIVLNFMII